MNFEHAAPNTLRIISIGLTFALSHLSKMIKLKYLTHWVLLLNLGTYVEEFEKQSTQNMDVAEVAIEVLLKSPRNNVGQLR